MPARKITIARKMSFEKFKATYGPLVDMTDSPKKDQFLVAQYKENIARLDKEAEEAAKAKLELEEQLGQFKDIVDEEEEEKEDDE